MRRTLKGTSLVEALVSSVIFLTVFLIAMDSLMNITRMSVSGPSPVEIEDAIRECVGNVPGARDASRTYDYAWGQVTVESKSYGHLERVLEVTAVARADNGRTVIYRYLLRSDEE